MLYRDVWGSIVKLTNDTIAEFKIDYPAIAIQFMDWEAHANVAELPNADLIGPTGLSITEEEPGFVQVVFALAVSTYGTDANLFRQRDFVGRIFEKMRPEAQVALYDADTAAVKSFLVFTDGTTAVPMSRADARPWQFVQALALLEPTAA